MNKPHVKIYTDGACSGNPGPGGWGVYLLYHSENNAIYEKKEYGSEVETTNNRMEILAAIMGLGLLKSSCKVDLYTDSVYLKNGITVWIHSWIKNNWHNSSKKLVKNIDLWQNLHKAIEMHDINWHWVKGHGSNHGNIIADSMACKGRDEAILMLGKK